MIHSLDRVAVAAVIVPDDLDGDDGDCDDPDCVISATNAVDGPLALAEFA